MTEKLFYKIGEVSKITGLAPYVLRFWESEFPQLRPKKNTGKQRVYTRKEIDLILQIKKILYQEGLTIEGARKRLARASRQPKDLPWDKIQQVKKELEQILQIMSGRSAAR